jgi:hypothetical protein
MNEEKYAHEDRRRAGVQRDIDRRNGTVTYRQYPVPDFDLDVSPDTISRALWAQRRAAPQPKGIERMFKDGSAKPRLPNTPRRPFRLVRFLCVMAFMIGVPAWLVLHSPPAKSAEQPFLLMIFVLHVNGHPTATYEMHDSQRNCALRGQSLIDGFERDDEVRTYNVACVPFRQTMLKGAI